MTRKNENSNECQDECCSWCNMVSCLSGVQLKDGRRSLLYVVLVQAEWWPWGQEVHKLSLKPVYFWTLREHVCSYTAFHSLCLMGAGGCSFRYSQRNFSFFTDTECRNASFAILQRELALLISTLYELKFFSFIIPIELIIVVFFPVGCLALKSTIVARGLRDCFLHSCCWAL